MIEARHPTKRYGDRTAVDDLSFSAEAGKVVQAGGLITRARQGQNDLLTPWQGYPVFAAWTVLLLLVAAILLGCRDA